MDLYGILCLPRNCTANEVRSSFFHLSLSFHPDKQPEIHDVDGSNAASKNFQLIERAYNVLINPVSRSVYDAYGMEGIRQLEEIENMQRIEDNSIVESGSTNDVLDLIRLMLEQRASAVYQHALKYDSLMEIKLDISKLMEHLSSIQSGEVDKSAITPQVLYLIDVGRLFIHQDSTIAISPNAWVNLHGYIISNNGLGYGGLSLSCALPKIRKMNGEVEVALTQSPSARIKLSHPTAFEGLVSLESGFTYSNGMIMAVQGEKTLFSSGRGTFRFSPLEGISSSIAYHGKSCVSNGTLEITPMGYHLSVGLRQSINMLLSSKVRCMTCVFLILLQVRINLGSKNGIEFGASRILSSQSKASFSFGFATQGVTLKIGFDRGSVRFRVPILVCGPSIRGLLLTLATALPAVFVSQRAFRGKATPRSKSTQYCTANSRGKDLAVMQQRLMKTVAERKARDECSGGLVIIEAKYGPSVLHGENLVNDDYDVTIPLQFFVQVCLTFYSNTYSLMNCL